MERHRGHPRENEKHEEMNANPHRGHQGNRVKTTTDHGRQADMCTIARNNLKDRVMKTFVPVSFATFTAEQKLAPDLDKMHARAWNTAFLKIYRLFLVS